MMHSLFKQGALLCALFLYLITSVSVTLADEGPIYLPHQRRAIDNPPIRKRRNVSSYEIAQAEKLVNDAVAQQGKYNAWRVDNPSRNTYESRHSSKATSSKKRDNEPSAPILDETLLAAAALLAENSAAEQAANGTLHRPYDQPKNLKRSEASSKRATGQDYWVSKITHTGKASMGSDPSYMVYRDVTNPIFAGGAKGDGVTDDTKAINAAIAYQSNCGANCLSSSTKGTLIYFPPGTYLISTPIRAYYYSQLVGDPNNLPIIKTSKLFIGLGAIESDVYYPNGNGTEWYVEQSNFYRQVRNLMIDITNSITDKAAGLHWQVAQATSLTNVNIYASTAANNTQMGLFTENGSGGFMSDCFIMGGAYGLYGGNQQYTVRNFEFSTQLIANVALLWDWGWTWSGLSCVNAPIGILLINPEAPTGQQAGSIYIMDSTFNEVKTAIKANFMQKTILETSIITLDNIGVNLVDTMVEFSDGLHLDIASADLEFAVIGNAKDSSGATQGMFGLDINAPNPSLLDHVHEYVRFAYFVKSRPQYQDLDVGSVISVKDHGAVGDGAHDDTSAIVAALALATTSNLIYFPAGSYIITSTIVIPPHVRMTGEVWSQLVASGPYFSNMASPKPMIKVGNTGDVGTVEISDILFTSIGALPGLIMVEWNVQAETPGSVGMWDSHFRVGGAYGSKLQVAQCPKSAPIQTGCIAAAMMLHITPSSNGYFENMWAWVADHDIDDATNTQVTVAVARGILIESAYGPTWLYGTASEHSVLYQYNFYNTTNTFAGMIQTESPYYQYTKATESPGPFNSSIGLFNNDPIFPDTFCQGSELSCSFSWAVMIADVNNLTIAGAGLYSWFDNYDQSVCVDAQNCQQRLINNQGGNSALYIWNLITIGAVEMISETDGGDIILAKNNTQAIAHPFWSALAGYLDDTTSDDESCDDDDTDPACIVPNYCDNTRSFATLADLQAATGSFPNICIDYYALGVLANELNTAMVNYTTVNKGYDGVFGDYVDYVKEMIPDAINTFMADSTQQNPAGGPGNKYFSCSLVYKTTQGKTLGPLVQQCPFNWHDLNALETQHKEITYTLTNSTGFYADLAANYAISNSSWVAFGTIDRGATFCSGRGGSCRVTYDKRFNFPVPAKGIVVPNPKDTISKTLPQIASLQQTMAARRVDLSLSTWYGPTDDILQVLSMPVLMIISALESMSEVKAIGEKEKKEKKLALILEILGIVFMFIPFLDDIAPELEIADGIFNIISAAGSAGLAIQQIVANPKSAPMDILGAIGSVAGIRTEKDFGDFAATRRGISVDDLKKISTSFETHDADFQSTIKHSCFL